MSPITIHVIVTRPQGNKGYVYGEHEWLDAFEHWQRLAASARRLDNGTVSVMLTIYQGSDQVILDEVI